MSQQLHQRKQSGDLSEWYAALHRGAAELQIRLESRLAKLRAQARKLDISALGLTVLSTGALIAALGEALGMARPFLYLAAALNTVTAVVAGLKQYEEYGGTRFRLEELHDATNEFIHALLDPACRAQPTEIVRQLKALDRRIVRLVPDLKSDKPWDNMSAEQREQFLQQRIAQ